MEIPVPDLRETRDWDGGKASAFAAAYVAHVAAFRHGFDYSPYEFHEDGFKDAAGRIEELIQLKERLGAEEFDARRASFGMSFQNGITKLVEHASLFPGMFYHDRVLAAQPATPRRLLDGPRHRRRAVQPERPAAVAVA